MPSGKARGCHGLADMSIIGKVCNTMNFFKYLGVSEDDFIEKYLQTGLVTESLHPEFPLNLFTYSRKAVHDNVWDAVTSRCRGIVINRETDEIVARPFEKFHNYGSTIAERDGLTESLMEGRKPCVIEKVDGFLCTGYTWAGKQYIASKGSFRSIHAKWATAEYNRTPRLGFPEGKTPVFEGLHRSLRIVVDYGTRQGLVLLALIDNETGEEARPDELAEWAHRNGFEMVRVTDKTLLDALQDTILTENAGTEEGYVLTWYNTGCPPYRLKVKFTEYLRLHRMVTGVSPKRIWEVLSQATMKPELNDYLTNSTPWFNKFVTKWVRALQMEYDRQNSEALKAYARVKETVRVKVGQSPYENLGAERKAWATEFQRDENKEFASILFAMLDNKDVSSVIWKRVKELTTNGRPMVDIHSL